MLQQTNAVSLAVQDYQAFSWPYAGGSSINVPISFRGKSVKSIMWAFIDNTSDPSLYPGVGVRNYKPISTVQLKVGTQNYPANPIRSAEELYMELQKSWNSIKDISYSGVIGASAYQADSFVGAIDLESFGANSGLLSSGIDLATNALPVNMEMTFNSDIGNGTMVIWAMYDKLVSVHNDGSVSVAY
jgi:hypothetical protein